MKKLFIYIIFSLLLFSCSENENITPSYIEKDWADELDMNNSFIKECYQKYGIGVMYDFDENTHFRYLMQNSWDAIDFRKIDRQTELDSAITYFNETFFQYFVNEEFIKKYLPRKILLCRDVMVMYQIDYFDFGLESDYRIGSFLINSLHSIYNKNGYAFAIKLNTIYYSQDMYDSYKMDNLYLFFCYLLDYHNFYDEFGKDFYLGSMEKYYGRVFSGEGDEDNNYTPGVYIEEGGDINDRQVHQSWYWEKGFVSTLNQNSPDGGEMIDIRNYDGTDFKSYKFPDRKRDVRNLFNQLLFVNQSTFDSYPDIIKNRLEIIVNKMDEWGIEIRRINPVIENAFPRK